MTHPGSTATAPQTPEPDDGATDVAQADTRWWRDAVVYQVYVRSFADENGDGIGDLAGVRARLPYLRDLGVDALWFNPWYPSPMEDAGYDISDYRSIDPAFGTLEEAEQLIAEARALGIRTIVDLVPEIAVGNTLLVILLGSLAGYAFAWLEFPGRDWIFLVVIGLLVVPLQMALIPTFTLYNHLGLYDTVRGIILFHTAFGLPFAIFLLRNYFVGIPRDILESARIDGASELQIFIRLILPLGVPAIASVAIFQFLWTWNDLIVALTFGQNVEPITVAIFSNLRQFGANIALIAPASFISLIVPLAVFFAFQRYFVQGLLAGSVK